MAENAYLQYDFPSADASHMHRHFMPKVMELCGPQLAGKRVLDVGCGNGFTCGEFARAGCQVTGIDPSATGIAEARKAYPGVRFEQMFATDALLADLREPAFDLIVSTEVVEHLYDPRSYVQACFKGLKPGGRFICTTPYHGYLKNLALSLADHWDAHHSPLWDCGHIKFWSRRTLYQLLGEAGFQNFQFRGAGRLPWLWMTMVVAADKPV
ncbi:MAG: class I SAM-dependent methyltransferase [Proteobacteria bacterium]|nr:class I SAM-dependent methyltransferase [Pseudomonadota bacterium]